MSVVSLVLLLSVFTYAYVLRDAAGDEFNLWNYLITNDIIPWRQIFLENFILWLVLYIPAQVILYAPPLKSFFSGWKFNAAYPSHVMMTKEFLRSLRGIFICSLLESGMYYLLSHGYVPRYIIPVLDHEPSSISVSSFLVAIVPLLLYGDAHFYFTHRLLHTKPFYRSVHKYHHESYNPTPFSGLSMHWFESFVYFTSAPSFLPFIPIFLFRVMIKSTIIAPLEGHAGYGSWDLESSYNHYIHHSKFDYNYGASPLWDHLLCTNYAKSNVSTRYNSAKEQARLVGVELKEE